VETIIDDDLDPEPPEQTINDVPPVPLNNPSTTRSGRTVNAPKHFSDYLAHSAFLVTFSPLQKPELELQPDTEAFSEPHPLAFIMDHVIAFIGSDPDTMHLEEALKQPDREQFIQAMHKELNDHVDRKHWKVIPMKAVPKDKIPIPMVWSMKRKRNPIGTIIKWKARLCAGGHKSIELVDYSMTYSPVVSWNTVRLIIVMALVNNDWYMQSIDFVLAFPQAPIKTDIFMRPPKVPHDFIIPGF
jgi:hypothetical protein